MPPPGLADVLLADGLVGPNLSDGLMVELFALGLAEFVVGIGEEVLRISYRRLCALVLVNLVVRIEKPACRRLPVKSVAVELSLFLRIGEQRIGGAGLGGRVVLLDTALNGRIVDVGAAAQHRHDVIAGRCLGSGQRAVLILQVDLAGCVGDRIEVLGLKLVGLLRDRLPDLAAAVLGKILRLPCASAAALNAAGSVSYC